MTDFFDSKEKDAASSRAEAVLYDLQFKRLPPVVNNDTQAATALSGDVYNLSLLLAEEQYVKQHPDTDPLRAGKRLDEGKRVRESIQGNLHFLKEESRPAVMTQIEALAQAVADGSPQAEINDKLNTLSAEMGKGAIHTMSPEMLAAKLQFDAYATGPGSRLIFDAMNNDRDRQTHESLVNPYVHGDIREGLVELAKIQNGFSDRDEESIKRGLRDGYGKPLSPEAADAAIEAMQPVATLLAHKSSDGEIAKAVTAMDKKLKNILPGHF